MGKADFGAVDGAIAAAFEEGEEVFVFGVEDDLFNTALDCIRSLESCMEDKGRKAYPDDVHDAGLGGEHRYML